MNLSIHMRNFSSGFLFTILAAVSFTVHAQNGTILESLDVESSILDDDVRYSVYLPAGYDKSSRRYPVLYLLHGFSDDETGWTQFGEVPTIADREMKSVEVTDMIIVMPDAGVSWYINNHDASLNYKDFFTDELIPHIDRTYRTRTQKQYRAVAGLSMGGYGTMILATKHPELFSAAAPLSAGILTDQEIVNTPEERWESVFGTPFDKDLRGEERLDDHYLANSILNIIETGDPEKLRSVRYYIDCGDDDFLIKGNMALHEALIDREIPHEFRVRDGGHTWSYWRTAMPEVLKFVSQSFHR